MKQLNRTDFPSTSYPTKIMQFGEGNFLRAFLDWQIDQLNKKSNLNAGVAVIRPIDYDTLPLLNIQDGLYTALVRGLNEQGDAVEDIRIVECVNEEIPVYKAFDRYMELATSESLEMVFSNTTEAGIEYIETDKLEDKPARAFPAKLTQWLYRRFQHFDGAADKGLIIVPCELIDYNGKKLKEIILKYCELWGLEAAFVDWLNTANQFCSTLVDRIVPGYPKSEKDALATKLGYQDNFMVACEYFHLFVIQGPPSLKEVLHLEGSGLNIKIVDDIYPYKQRKVAILNGAHTAMVPLAYLAGLEAVGDVMSDPLFSKYVSQLIFDEIIPTLDLPRDELVTFAEDVQKRFRNPYIHHLLISISLNSMSKFRTRLLPQLVKYTSMNKQVPPLITAALAGLLLFYRGVRNGEKIALSDSQEWIDRFASLWQKHEAGEIDTTTLVKTVLSQKNHWERDLTEIPGLPAAVAAALDIFLADGIRAGLSSHLKRNTEALPE